MVKKKAGRFCARKQSSLFNYFEGDLHNLAPAVAFINHKRGNKAPMPESVLSSSTKIKGCDGVIFDLENGFFPGEKQIGDVARAHLYMNCAYSSKEKRLLTSEEEALFLQWSKQDPVSSEECLRHEKIKEIQGNANPFVEENCKKK